MSLLEALIALIGSVPVGYEPVVWVLAAVFSFYFITLMFAVFTSLSRRR